jgi:hypothetical protein
MSAEGKLKAAAEAAGMTEEEFDLALERHKDNFRRLQLCGAHQFVDATPERQADKKFRCAVCQGVVSAEAAFWYNEGIRHGLTLKMSMN